MSDRIFLDANIPVSAAWRPDNGLLALWTLTDVTLLTSAYAIVEADRNVRTPEQRTRLHRLVQRLEIVDEAQFSRLPAHVRLPSKDVPILIQGHARSVAPLDGAHDLERLRHDAHLLFTTILSARARITHSQAITATGRRLFIDERQ